MRFEKKGDSSNTFINYSSNFSSNSILIQTQSSSDSELVTFDQELETFQLLYIKLHSKYGNHFPALLNQNQLIVNKNKFEVNPRQSQFLIPITIYTNKLSGLEIIVKYLRENHSLQYNEIAVLLNRSQKTIWQAYNSSKKKYPSHFVIRQTQYSIPLQILANRNFSVLESLVKYLKENYHLKLHEIASLLFRDQSTIWTVYNRSMKKMVS